MVEKGVGLIAEDFVFTGQDQALIIGGIGEKLPDKHLGFIQVMVSIPTGIPPQHQPVRGPG